jgi:chromosome segregation ATPase
MKKLDESICPKGCDRKLYDLAFKMRRERHEHERVINGKQKDLEAILMDYETLNQKLEKSKADYEKYRSKLSSLRHQKQTLLNDVDTIVMLKMDQMQYFKNPEEFIDIDNTLLFNKQNVLRLYSRVNKLADETIEAKRSHRINVVHLAKMKTDIQLMEKQIVDLKDSVNQAMLKKFGRVIDLNEVEETILRRFAFEMQIEIRSNAEDIKKQYFSKINELKVC